MHEKHDASVYSQCILKACKPAQARLAMEERRVETEPEFVEFDTPLHPLTIA